MQRCGSSWLRLTVLYKGGHAKEAPLKIQSLEKNIQEVSAIYGTIHLRRRHFVGGRGQKFAEFTVG